SARLLGRIDQVDLRRREVHAVDPAPRRLHLGIDTRSTLFRVPLESFTPEVREWFTRSFEGPTEAQVQAWPAIARGENVLLSAPTGSGKTLAAFLWALDRLVAEPGE